MTEKENDKAWHLLNQKYGIVDHVNNNGSFKILASQIKEFREPRLMTGFNHSNELPELFRMNSLSLLPESCESYVIGRFDVYMGLGEGNDAQIVHASLPECVESIGPTSIASEAIALNAAYSSGIIADFMGEEMVYPTISGRKSSGSFSFTIATVEGRSLCVNVDNAQMEIDAAYEGPNSLAIVIANLSLCEDLLLKQLYYPYRAWACRVNKKVRPIYLIYANRTFSLYEFAFYNIDRYESAQLVKKARYSIEATAISFDEIQAVYERTPILSEPDTPFPQANSIERILNLCERLDFRNLEAAEISETYEFVGRQAHYYAAAAEYLGLVRKAPEGKVILTDFGIDYLSKEYHDAQLFICERIFEHRPFYEAFGLIVTTGSMPSKETVAAIIEKYTKYTGSTPLRRASTVLAWLRWVCALAAESD